ncbi:methyl-accepting chemotaxis protein [bacterium]|nr:MAG: methyl-accepting chemotaxis protein [bacterium]
MKSFIDMPTSIKFFIGFGVVIALFIAVIIVASKGISNIQQTQNSIVISEFPDTRDTLMIKSNIDDMRVALLSMMAAKDRPEKAALHQFIRERSEELAHVKQTLIERNKDEPPLLKMLEELNVANEAFKQTRENELIPLIYAGKNDEAKKLAFGIQANRYEKMRRIIFDIKDYTAKETNRHMVESEANAGATIRYFLILGAVAVAASIFIALFSNTIIAKPLNSLSTIAEKVASGDLTVTVPGTDRSDEVGVLAKTIRAMIEKLQKETREITDAVNIIASSSSQMAATTAELASGTQQTAVSVSETSTTVEEVKQTASASTHKARHVAELAQNATQVSHAGAKLVAETLEGIGKIKSQMEYIAGTIIKLSEHSQAVGEIIAAVDDLAEQSNLLAVNASIEAAKAGESGKGFGVVAQEIRSLAEQSKQSTRQVRSILGDIQKASSAAAIATERGTKAVDAAVAQSGGTGDAIRDLSKSIAEASQAVLQISASIQQQLVGMDQVAGAMTSIKQATAQNASSTKQVEITVRNLQELGHKLKQMIQHYKV